MLRKFVVLSMVLGLGAFGAGCGGNECETAAEDLTTIAALCDTPVTYTFTGTCGEGSKACIDACGTLIENDLCDTAGATDCINACIAVVGE